MTPEERQKAILEAFYSISIYAMVTYTHSREGLYRLQTMMEIIDKVPVNNDTDHYNFNHSYYKRILEDAIKLNKEFNEDLDKKLNKL
jgi:hypothetical protein